MRPGKVDPKTLKTPVIFFFIAAAIYCVAAYGFGEFTRPMGFIMLAMFVAYMVANVRQMKNAPAEEHVEEEELIPLSKTLILLVAGAAVIAVGANLLVDNGTQTSSTSCWSAVFPLRWLRSPSRRARRCSE